MRLALFCIAYGGLWAREVELVGELPLQGTGMREAAGAMQM